MSMVSRRVFLKCIGVGSAAVASAALLGGCSGGDVPVSSGNVGNASGGNQNNNNTNSSSTSNSTNSSASSSSASSSSSEASSENTVTSGDIGKGYLYKAILLLSGEEREKNVAKDQGIRIYLNSVSEVSVVDDEGCVDVGMGFDVFNGSENIKIPMENRIDSFTAAELEEFSARDKMFLGKFKSKYMEVKCGTKTLKTAVFSGVEVEPGHAVVTSLLLPGQGTGIGLECQMPKDWTSAIIKYTLPYDPKKYINFIIYKEDANVF